MIFLQKSLLLLTSAVWHTKLHREQGLESYLVGLISATGVFRPTQTSNAQTHTENHTVKSLYKVIVMLNGLICKIGITISTLDDHRIKK